MKDLYLLNFNNYYNRTIKKFEVIEDYLPYLVGEVVSRVNFIPLDGLTATQIINSDFVKLGTPNYVVITDAGSLEITSRWFVIEAERTRTGQYNLKLKRDVIADYLNEVADAVSYINKATILDEKSPLLLNNEGFSFNEIKKGEHQFKDYTGIPWIVGYISPDVAKDAKENVKGDIEGYYDVEYASLSDYPYFDYSTKPSFVKDNLLVEAKFKNPIGVPTSGLKAMLYLGGPGAGANYEEVAKNVGTSYSSMKMRDQLSISRFISAWNGKTASEINTIINALESADVNIIDYDIASDLRNQKGKIIKVGENYYKVEIIKNSKTKTSYSPIIGSNADIIVQSTFSDMATDLVSPVYPEQRMAADDYEYVGLSYQLELTPIAGPISKAFNFDVKTANLSSKDTPYGIICMPYSDDYNVISSGGVSEPYKLTAKNRVKIMQALGSVAGLLYDIQLLPYCPVRNLNIAGGDIDLSNSKYRSIPVYEGSAQTNYITSIIIAQQATFSFSIPYVIKLSNIKLENETDKYRLCSPNYQGIFEFNPCKFFTGNKAVIDHFNVDCTYKPYTPYIHIAPDFNGLYGKDFNDARGLVCGGDFSLDRISDNWETYQYNNKNFEKQFDRQIESMELQHKYNMASKIVGGVGGAAIGGFGGNAIGGIAGMGVGIAAGATDAIYNTIEASRLGRDAIDAAQDQQKWSLQNIQAQPYALTKVSALNDNNKLFPFLEYYSCTDEEKQIFLDYLKYNGMTVNKIDRIRNYLLKGKTYYVKAGLVRMPVIAEDAHVLQDINQELTMGVYINAD